MSDNMPGDLLVILGFGFNIITGILFFMIAKGNTSYENLAKKVYHLFTASMVLASAYLFYLFFSGNYAIAYVYNYSDRALPFFFKLSAFWGGQEGTYLMWALMNACFGYILIYKGSQYRNWSMVIFSLVNIFFLFLMVKLSPFAMLDFRPPDGGGLNPLLQDPWMVIHPPVIFVGYSMAALPFSLAMAALILNDYSGWVKKAFPWAAITALMLAGGNILGGYWAYITLGWGGFWAWDPVENSSFIPWFVSLALVHGLIIEKRTGALRKTNLLMASFVFILVVYGTFLTRSGVLADFSVHSFVDLGINQWLIAFLAFYFLLTMALFLPRVKSIENVPLKYNIFNKEFIIFSGMCILFIFAVVVLFWTSLPITTGIFTDQPRAADLATYNDFALPFAIVFALFMIVAPLGNYKNLEIKNWQTKLIIIGLVSAALGFGLFHFVLGADFLFAVMFTLFFTGIIMYSMRPEFLKPMLPALIGFVATIVIALFLGVTKYLYLLFFAASVMVIITNLISIFKYIPGQWKTAGAQISHFGFGLMLIGILGSSAFTTNQKLIIDLNGSREAYGLNITYEGMKEHIETPKNKLKIKYEENGKTYQADPELYFSKQMNGIMRRPYLQRNLLYDIYFSPEQIVRDEHDHDLVLKRSVPKKVSMFEFTFVDYDMASEVIDGMLEVKAIIDVKYRDTVEQIEPGVQISATDNRSRLDNPATIMNNDMMTVSLTGIMADQDAISIALPEMLSQAAQEEQLVLDLSKKPLINMVWAGTTLILIGAIIVFVRRKEEELI